MANEDPKGRRESSERIDKGFPVLRADVAGIDVGSQEHWVCAPGLTGQGREVAVFGATTPGVEQLVAWLKERGVTSVALESTGSTGLRRTKSSKPAGSRWCWWTRGRWGVSRAAKKPIATTVNGSSGYTAVACSGARFVPSSRSVCSEPSSATKGR